MNSKPIYFFAFITLFVFITTSCTKTVDSQSTSLKPSKLNYITANVYIYDSIYNNWGTSSQNVVYVMNGLNNTQNWSNERLKFYIDGTFDEILTTGIWRQGNWSMNSVSTILYTTGSGFSNTAQRVNLNADTLTWIDNVNKTKGVQIAKH